MAVNESDIVEYIARIQVCSNDIVQGTRTGGTRG